MTYRGHVKNGVVVLDESAVLTEGTEVRVEALTPMKQGAGQKPPIRRSRRRSKRKTLGQELMKFAGIAKGLPRDLARNHDHYLYGVPKK